MSIISFTCDKNYFYILIYYIFQIGEALLEYFVKEKNSKEDEIKDKTYNDLLSIKENMKVHFMKIILYIFADLILMPSIIYTKCSLKKQKQEGINSKNGIRLIYNNPILKKSKKILQYTILISILDLVSRSVYFIFFFSFLKEDIIENLPKRYNMDYLLALDIILRFLFSRIILKFFFLYIFLN